MMRTRPSRPPPTRHAAGQPAAHSATPEITVLNKHEVEGILGREVRSSADEDMGRIVDVLVDRAGQVRAAIIDFGGFLGVGSRKIAVDWNALHFPQPGKPGERIALDLTRDQVRTAPEYKEGKPVRRPRRARQARIPARITTMPEMCSVRGTTTPLRRQSGSAARWRRRVRPAAGRTARHRRAAARAFAAQPARPRLVRLLCRRRADRFRPVRLGLPHHAKMDAGRYRPRAFRRRLRLSDWTNAGRRAGRRGALRTAGRRHCRSRAICFSALAYAALPMFPMVLSAAIVHALASCVLGPAIAAISLGLVGHAAISERLGRNARFASIGNGLAAAAMGAVRIFFTARASSSSPSFCWCRRCWRCAASPRARSIRSAPTARRRGARRQAADQARRLDAQPAAFDLCRLPASLSPRQRGDAAADGQRRHHALGALGDDLDRAPALSFRSSSSPPSRRGSASARRSGAAGRCC